MGSMLAHAQCPVLALDHAALRKLPDSWAPVSKPLFERTRVTITALTAVLAGKWFFGDRRREHSLSRQPLEAIQRTMRPSSKEV